MSDKDKEDWHDDSATLFRSARRAHDPTLVDRAAIDRVLARIQHVAPPSATTGSERASHGATSAKLVQIAKVSLAILGVTAAYFAFGRADPHPAASPASAPSAAVAPASAAAPAPAPHPEPNDLQPMRAVHREDESRARELPRRSRASAPTQVPSKRADAIVVEAPSSILEGRSTSAPQRSTSNAVVATLEPAGRESSLESDVEPALAPATEPAMIAPKEAPSTELAVLKRMQAALHAADYTTTLDLCAEHERRWPHGTFELEREGVRAIAACGESSDDAIPLAKAFLARHPHAAIAIRVSSACARQLQQKR